MAKNIYFCPSRVGSEVQNIDFLGNGKRVFVENGVLRGRTGKFNGDEKPRPQSNVA